MKQLEEKFGFRVTYLSLNKEGIIRLEDLKAALDDETILVSLMAVNNEAGAINPLHDIAQILRNYPKVFFHVDAVQGVGKMNINYDEIDLISFAGHKIHALNSCGGLLKRKKIELCPLNCGGGQENNYRSGTNDVAMAVSLSKAVRLALSDISSKISYITPLNRQIRDYLTKNSNLYEINSPSDASPYIINFSLKNRKASVVVEALSNHHIMVSSTSACSARKEIGSHVVMAMGKEEQLYMNTVRVSLDEHNTKEEISLFIASLDEIVRGIKQ